MPPKITLYPEGTQITIMGDHMTIKLSGEDTEGRFTSILQDNPPGTKIPMHIHEHEDEVYKVLEGEVEFTVNDETTLLKAGDTIFLPRLIPHTWKVVGTANAKVYLDIFPAGLERMFQEIFDQKLGPPEIAQVKEICKRYGVSFV
jgi:quercetin dioxygenase-like cupin family protein